MSFLKIEEVIKVLKNTLENKVFFNFIEVEERYKVCYNIPLWKQ